MVQGESVQVEDSLGGEYRASFSMETNLKEPHCRILFIHPEVCVDDSNFIFTNKIAKISKQSEMRGSCRSPSEQGMVSQFQVWSHLY